VTLNAVECVLEHVRMRIAVPSDTAETRTSVTHGTATYIADADCVQWSIAQLTREAPVSTMRLQV
jgi:hypothetical protein